ncbi:MULTISPECIES: pyridoxamine 5'-phosphate oxidase family protein [unclassified Brevibacterium]|uniref:pyridoxamine 5'-phosphate oxidase family protein n=1 Tax=unclassified Brevibacterium TaxID=2614124 RepID=UPI001F0CF051|nr:pyridoxamine 5'-phosphate oxidase family protein [Brevibacterium sp. S22]
MLWCFLDLHGDQATALRTNPFVNSAVAEAGNWLSVADRVEFVDDGSKVDELWDDSVVAWFEQGRNDPNLAL